MIADSHSETPSAVRIASRMKKGSAINAQPGVIPYQNSNPIRIAKAMARSISPARIDDSGASSRGKYTLLSMPPIETKLMLPWVSAWAKNCHGTIAAIVNTA